MLLRDTPNHYGSVTRLLHWTMALLLFWQLGGMIMKSVLGRVPLMKFWVGTHASVGALILALVVVRALWALRNRRRRPAYSSNAIGQAARIGHILLYLLMIVVPALALFRMAGSGKGVTLFGIEFAAPTGQEIAWMTAPANAVHGLLAWTLLALIAGHVAMVLVHRFGWRDDTLSRMLGRRVDAAAPLQPSMD
jgi:cytochrome b561